MAVMLLFGNLALVVRVVWVLWFSHYRMVKLGLVVSIDKGVYASVWVHCVVVWWEHLAFACKSALALVYLFKYILV